ncbi:MAG: right-handed parallel beta-helix repeat-containing protein, partial [Trichodesmium sp. St15_bin1_1]|nr:right-handed parallel beta-helix repeat-containing protein [Trichodesmium sp. St15_bin1_1]
MANIQVTTLIDENDGSLNQGDGNSLREAINFAGTGDTITFADNIDGGTINLTNGELVIDKNLTIDGNETNRVTINAQGNSRVFNINDSNNFIRQQVGIDGVVITGGNASGSGPNQSDGGGIFTNEALTLSNSIVTGNTAIGGVADGGGIYVNSIGSANITNTTISNNTATDDGGGVFGFGTTNITNSTINNNVASAATGDGGGVYIVGDTNITNSTISGNIANSEGGGVYVKAGSRPDATITNTTITNNQAPVGKGSGLAAFGSIQNTTVTSSIIAGNVNSDVDELTGGSNAIQSGGNNLIGTGNATTKFNVTTDITGVTNPGLEPLVDNGGPTQTHALQVGSIAIDAGSNSQGLTTDQRGAGFQRVIGNGIDIGAFEFVDPIPTQPPTSTPTPNTIFGTAGDD